MTDRGAVKPGKIRVQKSNHVPYAGDAFLVRSVAEVEEEEYEVLEAYVLFPRLDDPLQHDERLGLMWSKADRRDIDLTADDVLDGTLYRNALRIARDTVQDVTPDRVHDLPVLEFGDDVEMSALTPLAARERCRAAFKTIEDRTFNSDLAQALNLARKVREVLEVDPKPRN